MSIRQKILGSFIIVIVLLICLLASVFAFHLVSVREYKKISDTLILENTLIYKVSEYIEAYNAVVTAPLSEERKAQYARTASEITGTLAALDTDITDEDSRVAYQGLKNIIRGITTDFEQGLKELSEGNIDQASFYYSESLNKKTFVQSNSTELSLKELQHLDRVQKKIQERYSTQLFVVTWSSFFVILLAILYSLIFSKRITLPIKTLGRASQKVSAGDYSLRISKDLVERTDELGMLSNSFNVMLEKLNTKINQVEAANQTVLQTKQHLEERNAELERFNKMVIGRELKMVELKREISSLENKIKEQESRSL